MHNLKPRPLISATLVLVLAQVGGIAWAQSTVPIGAPERVQENIQTSRFDTRVLRQPVNEQATAQPRQSPRGVQPPDFAAHLNNLQAGGIFDAPRIQFEQEQRWPAVGATGWYPPDPDIAVGPGHVLVVVNSTIAWFDKTGAKQFEQTADVFFKDVAQTTFVFDPKCLYDRFNDRFVVLFVEEDDAAKISNVLLAVSDNANPNGDWYRYRFDAKLTINSSSYWLDYPGFGYTPGAYVVSGNMFGFTSGFAGVQFLVIPSAPLVAGQPASAVSLRDASGASVQMAEVVDLTTASAFGVSRSGSSALRVYAIQSPETTPTAVYETVAVPSNSSPATDAQSTGGKKLDTIDGRVFNAVWRNKRLVTAHSSTPSTGAPVAVRWYEVDTGNWPVSGAPTLVQAGLVSSPDTNYFMPAINTNAAGDISLLFSASSSSITANIMAAGRTQGDPTGTMGQPVVMRPSDGTAYSQGRWGDYFGVDVDPADDTKFWGVGEYVQVDNSWGTEVVNWNVVSTPAPPLPPAAPTNLTVTARTTNSIALSWQDNASNEDGYKIERSTNRKTWIQISVAGPNVKTFTDTGLKSRTTYYYRLRAYNTAGNSAYSSTVSAKTL